MISPSSTEAQKLLSKYTEKNLRDRLMKMRQDLITKHGVKFRVANPESFDHHVKVLSYYFVRGVDPVEWTRGRDMDPKLSEVRRGGLDTFFVIEQREKHDGDDAFEGDRKSKL